MVVFFLISVITSKESSITCPQHSWTIYKTVVDGPWSFVIKSDSDKPTVSRIIRRNTTFSCTNDNDLKFSSTRYGGISIVQSVRNKYLFSHSFSETCKAKCNSQNVTVEVKYRNKSPINMWSKLGEFTYLYKNCDKLYWTNWIETALCSSTRHKHSIRHCEDCDGDRVDDKYCYRNSTMHEDCQPTWGTWIEERPCVVTSCDSTAGEQIKRRECVYGDGSKATNYQLCSNHVEIVTEQCSNYALPIECTADTSSATQTDNTSLRIGIGVAVALIVLLYILLAVALYRC